MDEGHFCAEFEVASMSIGANRIANELNAMINPGADDMPTLKIPDLDGKAFLVTGASSGIGAAVAIAISAQGASVGIHYHSNEADARQVVDRINVRGGNAFLVSGDMAKHDEVVRIIEETGSHFHRLDGLVNNAGDMLGRIPTAESTENHDRDVVELNSLSVVWACRAALPWLKMKGGVIINTSSIAARHGGGGGAVLYAAAKGFVSTFTKGFAKEVVQYGVRVNAVSPGVVTTRFHERHSSDEQMKSMIATVPMGRAGAPADCVGTYLFLASDYLSGYVTGQTIEVNGGQYMV